MSHLQKQKYSQYNQKINLLQFLISPSLYLSDICVSNFLSVFRLLYVIFLSKKVEQPFYKKYPIRLVYTILPYIIIVIFMAVFSIL